MIIYQYRYWLFDDWSDWIDCSVDQYRKIKINSATIKMKHEIRILKCIESHLVD